MKAIIGRGASYGWLNHPVVCHHFLFTGHWIFAGLDRSHIPSRPSAARRQGETKVILFKPTESKFTNSGPEKSSLANQTGRSCLRPGSHWKLSCRGLPARGMMLVFSTRLPIGISIRWNRRDSHPNNPFNMFEVRIRRNQIGSGLHRVGGDPDIVGRNGAAFRPQCHGYS